MTADVGDVGTDSRDVGGVDLAWSASPAARALLTSAAIAVVAALLLRRWDLLVLAAPLLGALASLGRQRPPASPTVIATPAVHRCFEGETVRLEITLDAAGQSARWEPVATRGWDPAAPAATTGAATIEVTPTRWGRYPVGVRVHTTAFGGLLQATGDAVVATVEVYPVAPSASTPLPTADLPDRLGTHLTRRIGPGVEYAGIREYTPGDPLRTVNWPVSARRGRLHVTQRLTDRAADVVVVIDGSAQPAGPATTATEAMVGGAMQVVQTALRSGDRAGVVVLGDRAPRWVGADLGRRQYYAVLDAVLGGAFGDALTFETGSGSLAPRAALPPGALVVVFSTLLDTGVALALLDIARRGHTVVAVDVLAGFPLPDVTDPLVVRMWSLQRALMYRDMAAMGVDVVAWPPGTGLEQTLRTRADGRRTR